MSNHYFDPRLKIFSLNSNKPLAEKIAKAVGVELGKSEVKQFSDGEIQINIEQSSRGGHVYLIQSTSNPVNGIFSAFAFSKVAFNRAEAIPILRNLSSTAKLSIYSSPFPVSSSILE